MLQSKLSKNSIITIKYNNGMEIVGKLDSDFNQSDATIDLKNPLELRFISDQKQSGLGFLPFMLSSKDNEVFSVPVISLMAVPVLTREEIKKSYIENTSSLILP